MDNLPETTGDTSLAEKNQNDLNWDRNHTMITEAIFNFVNEMGGMPTVSHIVKATGLNRKTVQKHVEPQQNEQLRRQDEVLGLMANHVKAQVLKSALSGDNHAAKLFLEATGKLRPAKATTQNNFVQINKTTINQQIIQQLKPEVLAHIEEIIAQELNPKEE